MLAALINQFHKIIDFIIFYYIVVLFSFALFINIANIPYFNQFFTHINASANLWVFNSPGFVARMVFLDKWYLFYLCIYLVLQVLLIIQLRKLYKRFIQKSNEPEYKISFLTILKTFIVSIALIAVCILGIRGRTSQKSAIRVGTAYFCNYAFANQLGLNPVFSYLRSCLDLNNPEHTKISFLADNEAKLKASQYLNTDTALTRICKYDSISSKPNVILIMMEGMSLNNMGQGGNPHNLTPFLDSISTKSLFFENFYSSGIHTMDGVYSILFGYPSILEQHPMNKVVMPEMSGIPVTLKQNGYKTIYFTTHDEQFDNVAGFFTANGVDSIVSQKDYPSNKVISNLGVPDDYMFDFSMPTLKRLSQSGKPFLAVYMTASNHTPIIIPPGYPKKLRFDDDRKNIIEYSDWALSHFYNEVKKQHWFKNTIFVFVADHGNRLYESKYEMPISYNHIPLIINWEHQIKPEMNKNFGGQIDIFPMLMDILKINYVNNTLGVNILKEKRPCMYYCFDQKIGVLNDSLYLIIRPNSNNSLYRYRELSVTDESTKYPEQIKLMQDYVYSMLQTAQWMVDNKQSRYIPFE